MPDRQPESISELRAVTQPAELLNRANAEHWAGRLYGRRVSAYLTRLALRLGLSPNAVTGVMIVVGLAGAVVLAIGGWWPALAGFLLIQLYLVLDCVDGEVARWTGKTSAVGIYLDRLGHYLVEGAVLIAIGISATGDAGLEWTVVGLVAGLGVLVSKAETDLVATARLAGGLGPMPKKAIVIGSPVLAGGRRLAALFPIHRGLHAIEATCLALLAALVDLATDSLIATRALAIGLAALAWLIAVLHLVSILKSARLTLSSEEGGQEPSVGR